MKKLFVVFAATLIIAGLFFPSAGVSAEKLFFVTSPWPPYIIISEEGKATGLGIDIVLELCKRLGFEADIQVVPWKRALKYMKDGEADALYTPRYTEERAEFMYYPSEPIHMERTVIFAQKGSGIKVNKIDDLKGKVIGTVRGYSYGPEFDNYQGFERKDECDDDEQLIKIFAKKRVPLIAGIDEGSMKYLCKKEGIEAEVAYVLDEAPSYITFSKARGEKGKELAEKFGEMLRKLKEEGVIQKIESKYF